MAICDTIVNVLGFRLGFGEMAAGMADGDQAGGNGRTVSRRAAIRWAGYLERKRSIGMAQYSYGGGYGTSLNTGKNVLDYLRPLIHVLLTPLGLVAFVIVVAFLAYGWQGRRGKEALLFLAALAGMVGYFNSKFWNNTLIHPLELLRSACKPLFVVAIILLAMRYVLSYESLRRTRLRTSAVAYLLLLFLSTLRLLFDAPERAIAGSLLVVLSFFGVLQLFRRSISTGEDVVSALSSLVIAGLCFYALSSIQLLLGARDSIVFGGRFCGLGANAQSTAEITASLVAVSNYLLISGFAKHWQKLLGGAGLVVMLPFLVWTGSRTGVGMAAVSLLIMNGARARRWIVLCAVSLIAWEVYTHFFSRAAMVAGRLVSTTNDRSSPWATGWHVFVTHPLLGEAFVQHFVENSFISVAMLLGMVGVGILFVLIFSQAGDILYVLRNKGFLDPESRKLCDFVIALALGFAAGMFFDAYLLAIATTEAVLACMVLGLTSVACDLVSAQAPSPGIVNPALSGAGI
jgi:hypothetical protein